MSLLAYNAAQLYEWISSKQNILILDVRNQKDFGRFKVEGPFSVNMINVSYYDFMEEEEASVAQVPIGTPIRIVCAQEGSAKYVGEILEKHGYPDVGYLQGGIKTWGNLLIPRLINPGQEFELYQFIRPAKAACGYGLIYNNEIMLFDPTRDIDFYMSFAESRGVAIIKTFETHLQADYIAGSRLIHEKTGAIFYGHDDFKNSKMPYTPLTDGDTFSFSSGGPTVNVVHTPGHTPGSTTYIIDDRYMISGDTEFINSIGRPDLGGKAEAWASMLFETLQTKLLRFDDSLQVLPGHFMDWSEANEDLIFIKSQKEVKKRNETIYSIDTEADFFQFIKDNMRPQPEEYATIRLINANLRQEDDEQQEILDLGKNECAATAYAKSQETA
ncbi:MAG: MBL fold metallo-hydrolase [Desulfobulbaceae bacterium]|uniref:MBL fold metallo-hydrolase n=1 Tax=Candidatus Desulfobia pelagia TaxID=2841692 RepID=A0A8J6NH15_9BACT|nr:MBL fold metallo-hydrolase [Candidatus Desulfobia pelagia]